MTTDALQPAPFPKPRITRSGFFMAALCWAVLSLIGAIVVKSYVSIPFIWALEGQLFLGVFMGILSIPFWLLTIRWMDSVRWRWKFPVHFILAPLFAFTVYEFNYQMLRLITPEGAQSLSQSRQWIVLYNIILYAAQFAIYHGFQTLNRLRIKERQAAELLALAKEQDLAILKSQINPHFFFNTLNSISALASQNPEESRAVIAQFADLLRYAMDSSKKEWVSLRQEVDCAKSFLAIEARRLGDRLQLRYDVDEKSLELMVPPLILQALVENAVRHGIEPSEEGGTIALRIAGENDALSVSVHDSGVGFNAASSTGEGIGLKNTDARLRKLYGEQAGLWTKSPPEGGFEVGFTIPLKKTDG
jgi:two-component system LytT family sensor kinase